MEQEIGDDKNNFSINRQLFMCCKDNNMKKYNSCSQSKKILIKDKRNVKYNNEYFIEQAIKKHGYKFDYSKVDCSHSYDIVEIICKEHGSFFQKAYSHLEGYGCLQCRHDNKKNKNYLNDFNKIHNNKYLYDNVIYINNHTKIEIICKEHGNFFQTPKEHLKGSGCPYCSKKMSLGERKILKWLEENNIEHITQYTFKECRYKNVLPFDFYLPEKNILIEYDGEQHFSSKEEIFKDSLELIKIRDNIKNEFAKKNNIKLIRIPFFKNKEISNILKETIID